MASTSSSARKQAQWNSDARVSREFGAGEKRVRPYVRAGLEGVSGGNTAVTLSGYRFNGSGVGNSWIAGTGIDARFGKSTTLSVDGGYRGNLGAAGAEGLEGNLTFKKAFWASSSKHVVAPTQKAGSENRPFAFLPSEDRPRPRSDRPDRTSPSCP